MKDKTSIEIDLDVYKFIAQHRKSFKEPENEILRRILKIADDKLPIASSSDKLLKGGLVVKGTFLRNGMQLRKHFKGNTFEAIVRDGHIEFNKRKYTSPSGAAVDAAGGSVNGWRFWDYLDENDNKWKLLETLRTK